MQFATEPGGGVGQVERNSQELLGNLRTGYLQKLGPLD